MVDFTALPGSLDLFEIMVNYLAGSILLSLIIWGMIILITCIMGRMSMKSILVLEITYLATVSIGYVGALSVAILFPLALWYMITNIVNAINAPR